jgi:hypothetical protein
MRNERREQATPATPILDSILAKLPPPKLTLVQEMVLEHTEYAQNRLLEKLEKGTLTQADIETELSSLPDQGGSDYRGTSQKQIVELLRLRIPGHDIKRLPKR